jgi:uncharacterized protein
VPLPARRFLIFGALIAACSWIGAAVYLGELMVRLPRKPLPPQHRWAVAAPEQVEILAADGIRLRGWFFRAPEPNGASVILLHGQTDNRAGVLGFADFFLRHGFNALTPDFRAHGESEGELATYGFREADDLRRWVDWLEARQPGAPVFGAGESMGAAILLQTLSVEQRFCAVVAEAPYATLREIAYERLWQRYGYGPWRYALRPVFELALLYQRARYGVDLDRVSPEQAVAHSRTPVLLIYGTRDDNTPPRHAQSIYQKNPGSVTAWEVAGAGHTGAWNIRPQEFERRVLDWFSRTKCP